MGGTCRALMGILFGLSMVLSALMPATLASEAIRASSRGSGVELSMTPEELDKLMFIHPSEIKGANLTVKNTGNETDTIVLNITINYRGLEGSGWQVWLADNELELTSMELAKTILYVKGPTKCTPGDFIEVNITATSSNNNTVVAWLTIQLWANCPCEGVEIIMADNIHLTDPGEPTEYLGTVKNLDPWNYSVLLSIDAAPEGWNVTLDLDAFDLKPSSSTNFHLWVGPPLDALGDEMGIVTVKAVAKGCSEFTVKATARTVVWPHVFISMALRGPDTVFVDPGDSIKVPIDVEYDGNLADAVIFIVELISATTNWTAVLDRSSVSFVSFQKTNETIMLTVTSPAGCQAGQKGVVRIGGYNEAKTISADASVDVVCRQVRSISYELTPGGRTLDPGDVATFKVKVSNHGNGFEFPKGAITGLPEEWTAGFLDKGLWISEVALTAGSTREFDLRIEPPVDTLEGTYEIDTYFDFGNGLNISRPVNITINHIPQIQMDCSKPRQSGIPGGNVTFPLVVKNLGNGRDTIELTVGADLPQGWSATFVGKAGMIKNVTLGPMGSVSLLLNLSVPGHPEALEALFDIFASSVDGPSINVPLEVTLRTADLTIVSVVHGAKGPVRNKPYCFDVKVNNNGTVAVGPVVVDLYVDGVLAASRSIDLMSPDVPGNISLCWMPAATGVFVIRFVVDPQDKIVEDNEDNNAYSLSLKVPKKVVHQPGFDAVYLALAIIMAAVVLVGIRKS